MREVNRWVLAMGNDVYDNFLILNKFAMNLTCKHEQKIAPKGV